MNEVITRKEERWLELARSFPALAELPGVRGIGGDEMRALGASNLAELDKFGAEVIRDPRVACGVGPRGSVGHDTADQ